MASERYNTFDPQLAFHVLRSGGLTSEELLERTLSFRYIDRAVRFDEVRWQLDNKDGALTKLKNMAAGLTVMIQFGYPSDLTPWRAFVMTALSGSVGVYGQLDPPVGNDNTTIELTGRNRNAPAPRTGRNISRTPPMNPNTKSSSLGSTSSVTNYEMLLTPPESKRRAFPEVKCTSEAVQAIALLCGFTSDYLLIEDSSSIEKLSGGVAIPEGETYGGYIERMARRLNWLYKINARGFHFHSRKWEGPGKQIRDYFSYTAGLDILDQKIECDFRLPVPSEVRVHSFDPQNRIVQITDVAAAVAGARQNGGLLALRNDTSTGAAERKANIFGKESFPSGPREPTARAVARFTKRYENAVRLVLTVVGNPRVLAADLVNVSGTGNELVDATWNVEQAEHIIAGKPRTYTTVLNLNSSPKLVIQQAQNHIVQFADQAASMAGARGNMRLIGVRNQIALRSR